MPSFILYCGCKVFCFLLNTGPEPPACGTPVVAFRIGGLADIVDDRHTGALADPFKPDSLAQAIRWVLQEPHLCKQRGVSARKRAVRLWDQALVAGLYADVFLQAMEQDLQT